MTFETVPAKQDGGTVRIQPVGASRVPWGRMTALPVDPQHMDRQRIVSFQRHHPAALAFDIMRTKLLKDARQEHWRTLGITAPTAGCGKATVAANLAISLTKHEKIRVGLVDLDLRRPRIAQIFPHSGQYSTDEFLRGECLLEDFLVRLGDNLAIGASPDAISYPAELLHGQSAAHMLDRLREELGADLIIYNLPSLLESDDCLGLLPLIQTSLLVVGAEFSSIADIDVCERTLHAQTRLLGVVLNKCRYDPEQSSNFQI
jgi:Mrp family chromosome partitioning ATPase